MSAGPSPRSIRERQARLRSLYRERPEAAITTKWARTSASRFAAADDPVHGEVEIGREHRTIVRVGLDHRVGGLDDRPNPGDLLCGALAACEDSAVRMVASLLGVSLEDLQVEVSGEVDVRGALSVDAAARVGFERLRCRVQLRTAPGTPPESVKQLVAAASRACVNLDTLRRGVTVEVLASE